MIISAPGLSTNTRSNALVELVDLYPTLSDLARLPKPHRVQGVSFAPIVRDPKTPGEAVALSQYPRGSVTGYSMCTDRYRFTLWRNPDDSSEVAAVELYDHHSDPGETKNLATDSANAVLIERLTQQFNVAWDKAHR